MKRRDFLKTGVFSGMSVPFMSAITGLPLSFLTTGSTQAQSGTGNHKFCILSTSSGGQPLNIYAPGAYVPKGASAEGHPAARIVHAGEPQTNPQLNNQTFNVNGNDLDVSHLASGGDTLFGASGMRAAKAYDSLPPDLLNHLTHAWYGSGTQTHSQLRQVLKAHGHLKRRSGNGTEELPSAIAQETAESLGTILDVPWSLNGAVTSNGVLCPRSSPAALLSVMAAETNRNIPLLYNVFMERFHSKIYKTELTGLQKSFVDEHLFTSREAENIGAELKSLLTSSDGFLPIQTSSFMSPSHEVFYEGYNQLRAALAMFYLNLTPVVVVGHQYGGDNHSDGGFNRETGETLTALESLNQFHKLMTEHPVFSRLKDKVTYAAVDVFGRTPFRTDGRDHSGGNTVGILYGHHLKGTVLGGPDTRNSSPYDPKTGVINRSGDVTLSNSLASFEKTVMSACGISDEVVNQRLPYGFICNAIKA